MSDYPPDYHPEDYHPEEGETLEGVLLELNWVDPPGKAFQKDVVGGLVKLSHNLRAWPGESFSRWFRVEENDFNWLKRAYLGGPLVAVKWRVNESWARDLEIIHPEPLKGKRPELAAVDAKDDLYTRLLAQLEKLEKIERMPQTMAGKPHITKTGIPVIVWAREAEASDALEPRFSLVTLHQNEFRYAGELNEQQAVALVELFQELMPDRFPARKVAGDAMEDKIRKEQPEKPSLGDDLGASSR